MTLSPDRWRCRCCGWVDHASGLLKAPHPFIDGLTVSGCPKCREVDEFDALCDEPGCMSESTCGFPDGPSVYRRTCFRHSIFNRKT